MGRIQDFFATDSGTSEVKYSILCYYIWPGKRKAKHIKGSQIDVGA